MFLWQRKLINDNDWHKLFGEDVGYADRKMCKVVPFGSYAGLKQLKFADGDSECIHAQKEYLVRYNRPIN